MSLEQKMKPKNILTEMPQRIPVDGTFELTVRCNLHCKMCLFRHDDSENAEIMKKELTAEQWIDMAKQAAEAGTFSLLITGGEPMLRPDFCEIWEGIYKLGFMLTLYTNGTLVNPKIMELLRKYPPHKIGVTIYGSCPEVYEKVSGSGDAFEKAMRGICQLQTLPSTLEFRTTIIKDNYEDVDRIEELVHKTFGEQYKLTNTRIVTQSVRGACADVNTCRLEPEDNIRLAFRRGIKIIKEHVGDSYDENNLVLEHIDLSKDSTFKPRITLFGCNAGMDSYTISWDGKLLGCQMLGAFETNALKDGFQKAWEDYPLQVKIPEPNKECEACKSAHICNSCFASRYAETGMLNGKPEYVCRDTEILQSLYNRGGNENEKK